VDRPAQDAARSYRSMAVVSLLLTAFMLGVVTWAIAVFP